MLNPGVGGGQLANKGLIVVLYWRLNPTSLLGTPWSLLVQGLNREWKESALTVEGRSS